MIQWSNKLSIFRTRNSRVSRCRKKTDIHGGKSVDCVIWYAEL